MINKIFEVLLREHVTLNISQKYLATITRLLDKGKIVKNVFETTEIINPYDYCLRLGEIST